MNIITCNAKQTSGVVYANGIDARRMGKEYRALLGYVPQQQGLYPSFTLARFMAYMSALKGLKHNAEQERELLLRVNLSEHAGRKLGGFSGGMKQRALLAQALLGDPKILVLDEPTAGLDPKERVRLRETVREAAANKIVIFATHVVSDIEKTAKKVLFLKQGKLILADDTFDLPLEERYMSVFGDEE